ncbi:MAG TPA: sigma 54-interacting transcriptional regulator [Bdellovibrionota bacterium]|nr:sigma 54-interacting transcriptional regulator [Bdellovibrionota bacterium]
MEMVHFIPPRHRGLTLLAAQADAAPVLIYGASGTGKGAIARWIHQNSARAAKALNQATRDEPLAGQISASQGGTLVVNEIGSWTLSEQRLLLDFLKTRSVSDAASSLRMLANVRIIATTSQALEGRAQGGLFNAELLEKLNVFRIEMPPLAKREDEFEDIVLGVMGELAREVHKEHLRELEPEAWQRLRVYDWPGNIRELRNVLKLAVISAKGDRVAAGDLPEFGHDRMDFRATREQFEKVYIQELLKSYDWEIDRACRLAGMDKPTLLAKIESYGLKPDSSPEARA